MFDAANDKKINDMIELGYYTRSALGKKDSAMLLEKGLPMAAGFVYYETVVTDGTVKEKKEGLRYEAAKDLKLMKPDEANKIRAGFWSKLGAKRVLKDIVGIEEEPTMIMVGWSEMWWGGMG